MFGNFLEDKERECGNEEKYNGVKKFRRGWVALEIKESCIHDSGRLTVF
jgi:hypothetical protein